MPAKKRFGVCNQLVGKGSMIFVGYCPYCEKKHYIGIREARELARIFFDNDSAIKRIFGDIRLPKIKVYW
jgi:hypothetical protein